MAGMLKTIAWNGICLCVPCAWDLVRIDTRHLFFDNHARPAMEIKWRPVKGRFSHRSHLKKLIAQQKHYPDRHVEAWHLPSTWEKALSNFIAKGFSWQSGTENGRGAILFCSGCKTAIIFQIFNMADHLTDETTLEMLKSLQDHRSDHQTDWTVFDIHARLPKTFQLVDYLFKPGNYKLALSDGYQALKLFRWAPASAFLSQSNLAQFAASSLAFEQQNLVSTRFLDHPAVEWRSNTTARWHNWLGRFKRKPVFHWVRVWHLAEKNRILGIRFDSKRPIDMDLMTTISANYSVRIKF